MSYDIRIVDEAGETLKFDVPHYYRGSTYAVEGEIEARYHITINYNDVYQLIWGHSLRFFDSMSVSEALPKLRAGIEVLGSREYKEDYWAATPGNAGKALVDLVAISERFPQGIIRVEA